MLPARLPRSMIRAAGRRKRPKALTGNPSYITQWTYNSADLPITMTYPDGEVVTNNYTSRMSLNSVIGADPSTGSGQAYVQSTAYDSAGRMDDRLLGNNLTQNYSYYAWTEQATVDSQQVGQGGRLRNLTVTGLQNLTYTYDAGGNIRKINDTVTFETQNFGYDTLDRLTSSTVTGGYAPYSETYGYNAATGNLTTKGSLTLQYNNSSHAHAVTNAGSNTYSYDNNGNQTTRVIGALAYNLAYDAENRLVSVTTGSQGNSPSPVLSDTLSQGERGMQGNGHTVSYAIQPPQQSGFPSTSVQDDFNRADGSIGSNWSGATSSYSISSNQLSVGSVTYGSEIYWNPTSYGADQEAYMTFSQVNSTADAQGLVLKAQGTGSWGNGLLEVLYVAPLSQAQVWTYTPSQGWVQRGASISATFANGDQLGARAKSNGDVEVYKNGTLLATRSVTAWTYYNSGGRIGLAFVNASGAKVDDFGGGTVSTSPTATPTASATPTATFTPTSTSTPTQTPSPMPTSTFTPIPSSTPPPPAAFNNATFVYDGDGKRVKSTINGTTTTYFVGSHYEVTNGVVTKYYYAGAQRIAMRTNGTLSYLLGDHLGSTSLVTDSAGNKINEQRYKAWGETRYASGSEKTRYQYTGQFSYTSDFGLYFYNARWYDSYLNHFTQPDTDVPASQGVQGLDRYAYVSNNPLRYTDPTGHAAYSETEAGCSGGGPACIMDMWSGYDDADHMMAALRNWVRYHKDYSPVTDNKLSDEEKATVSIAMFQAAVEDTPKGASLSDILKNTFSSAALVGIFGIINEGINMSPDDNGGGGGWGPRSDIIQYGGHTIKQSTLDQLGVNRADMHEALRLIREEYRLPNSFHGNIAANGDYINPANGTVLGNIYNYIP